MIKHKFSTYIGIVNSEVPCTKTNVSDLISFCTKNIVLLRAALAGEG
ncbi:MAG: hypothetical protein LC100_15210 [Chitinophagales bacterium]|nr:hypothetical protein [Chitinophagales bacterium]